MSNPKELMPVTPVLFLRQTANSLKVTVLVNVDVNLFRRSMF